MSKTELEQILTERVDFLSSGALKRLAESPKGIRIPAAAVAVRQDGVTAMLIIPQPEHRLAILAEHAKVFGTVGFGLVYDGYVSTQCRMCDNRGCEQCQGMDKSKCDAIVTVVRAKWGLSATRAVGYGYDADGHFILRPQFSRDFYQPCLDEYDSVFGERTMVN